MLGPGWTFQVLQSEVKVQGHGVVQCAGKCTFLPCLCDILKITALNFTRLLALVHVSFLVKGQRPQ